MGNQQQQVAEIHLNPANLGPVEVMLSITQDQATAQFVSPHASVREAIQDALPRLKEMLADNGIQLGNVTVGAESFQQGNQQQAHNLSKDSSDRNIHHTTETRSRNEINHTAPIQHQGIVNTYA
jgi:flagellar hook-length control protein FliK